jgi:SSS family transporter
MQILIVSIIIIYFLLIFFISRFAGGTSSNATFFSGNHNSRWQVVAVGMVSATISGISVVSVPGMVGSVGFTYMQMVFGFFFGYAVVVYVLLPLYYKLHLTSIYGYLGLRFGRVSHQTGACFFILFKMVAAASRLYIVILVLQFYLFDSIGVPFVLTALIFVLFIFAYTCRTGIKALVWTDFFQTLCMVAAIVLLIVQVYRHLGMDVSSLFTAIQQGGHSRLFVFDDFYTRQNFFKQFLSGVFVVIVMTGLDQDIMQKNLTCRNLAEARKDMLSYGFCFIPVNFLFLVLGAMLLVFAGQKGIAMPEESDKILPYFAMNYFGGPIAVLFVIALLSAAFSSADSALVSLTTSFSVDILHQSEENISYRRRLFIHFSICMVFILVMLLFRAINSQNALDSIYTIVSYLYGPLLGLFVFGLFTKWQVRDGLVPLVTIVSPILCYVINALAASRFDYHFGYELLMLNGLLTFIGLCLIRRKGVCGVCADKYIY